jgi:hypothetical protein
MPELSPKEAAELAGDVYLVQTDNQVGLFLLHPIFSIKGNAGSVAHKHLKSEVGGRVILNTKDGFGVCAQGGDAHKNELFLVFRGTTMANKKADVLTDARIGIKNNSAGLPVHCGFDHCFTSMLPDMQKFIIANNTGVKTVHCIGHSLGGAIALLAADWVVRNIKLHVKLYTFGAPRVGTENFVKSTTSAIGDINMHRVYHRTDPVPMVPLYPFMHAPYRLNGHYIFSAEPLTSGAAHRMTKYNKSVTGRSWTQLNEAPEQPYTIESAIESWLESKTPVDSSSPAFWRWVDSALIYVIKKVAMSAILGLQAVFIGAFTLADRIAYILAKGIDLAENVSIWVERLMRKLMEALGMKVVQTKKELTQSLIRHVLQRITEKANKEASDALRKL